MKCIGITGGFGSGKSTVTNIIRQEGIPVIDADDVARHVLESDESILPSLEEQFGSEIIDKMGRLDREKLAAIVFEDAQALSSLNEIMHPSIHRNIERQLGKLSDEGHQIAFVDVPLLFEVEWDQDMDGSLVVWAPLDVCVDRLMRQGMERFAIIQRIAAQLPLDKKRDRADWWIDNSASLNETTDKTLKLLSVIKQELRLDP